MSGWPGRLFKGWTVLSRITAGTGLPETPVYLAAVPGTGYTGTIRPDLTGAPIYSSLAGVHLNAAAYAAPMSGNGERRAGIRSPDPTSSASIARSRARSARLHGSTSTRVDAANLLNHGVFTSWNTTVNSTQFGVPVAANPMRSLEISLRLRF